MICVHLTRQQLVVCWQQANQWWLGGNSQIREVEDRREMLIEDQLVGQIGNAAGCLWWYGNMDAYLQSREIANADPWRGDGGSDLPGLHIDFKTSMMRGPQDPAYYKLLVRPAERHKGCVYIRVLIPKFKVEELGAGLNVFITGWAKETDLPDQYETDGIFAGAYSLESDKLRPIGAAYASEILASQFPAPVEPPVVHDF